MATLMDPPTSQPPDDPGSRGTTRKRDTSADGRRNRFEFWAFTHAGWFWRAMQRHRRLERLTNRILINGAVENVPMRPYPFSMKADYTSWDTLTDRHFNGRQLERATPGGPVPPNAADVAALFERDAMIECPKSTVLFAYLAQWFTDGFLRTERMPSKKGEKPRPRKIERNISNHQVDMSQLYGFKSCETEALRAHVGGRLRSVLVDGEEYPPRLCADDGTVLDRFKVLPEVIGWGDLTVDAKRSLWAMGSDAANSQLGYAMFNVLFLREHNRIAGELAGVHRDWDDDRLFETARNVLTVLLIKLVIEEYINHIAPYHFKLRLRPGSFERSPWMRPNWECVEFNLLYRWHSLIPDELRIDGRYLPLEETLFGNRLIAKRGLGAMFEDASRQRAGRIGLFNTAKWFAPRTLLPSVRQSREAQLRTYNDYREHCGYPRVTDFDQISSDEHVCDELARVYGGNVNNIEFYVGLFAEDLRPNSVLPPLMGRLVGAHAFSQLMTNPLLAPSVYTAETFSVKGLAIIDATRSLEDLVSRNVPGRRPYVSLTREGWTRES